jgi:hypothetical protein
LKTKSIGAYGLHFESMILQFLRGRPCIDSISALPVHGEFVFMLRLASGTTRVVCRRQRPSHACLADSVTRPGGNRLVVRATGWRFAAAHGRLCPNGCGRIRTTYQLGAEGVAIAELPRPHDWTGDRVLFAAGTDSGYVQHVWELSVAQKTGRATGSPRQVTASPSVDVSPRRARDGRLVFGSVSNRNVIIGVPLDSNAGRTTGALRYLRSGAIRTSRPSASADGRWLVYPMLRPGGSELWLKDLKTDRRSPTRTRRIRTLRPSSRARGAFGRLHPPLDRTGHGGRRRIRYRHCRRRTAESVRTMSVISWLNRRQQILIYTAPADGDAVIDVDTGKQVPVVSAGIRRYVSPNEKWVAFSRGGSVSISRRFVRAIHPGNANGSRSHPILLKPVALRAGRRTADFCTYYAIMTGFSIASIAFASIRKPAKPLAKPHPCIISTTRDCAGVQPDWPLPSSPACSLPISRNTPETSG